MTINTAIFTVADAFDCPGVDSLLDTMMTACQISHDVAPIAWTEITGISVRGEISDPREATRIVALDMTNTSLARALDEVTWACHGDRVAAAGQIREWVIAGTPAASAYDESNRCRSCRQHFADPHAANCPLDA